ncbi:plasmid mobilization protein [Chroococcidiopsis thermalis]|uniref:Mobilization protein n=1 Tax=Chroococcidiopsis thermalis (strain PCC 7203) TaxID=251229 RepID=K9U943_CHRTP|nr:hypothetical protein [Chroococcidiopsis thermalis]AFY91138.1 hypothetical protein Chro_5799 [Chroococcidiopsis thermalis PCC 7203]
MKIEKQKKNNRVTVRFNDRDYTEVKKKAKKSNTTVAEYIERSALRRELPTPPTINQVLVYQNLGKARELTFTIRNTCKLYGDRTVPTTEIMSLLEAMENHIQAAGMEAYGLGKIRTNIETATKNKEEVA